MRRISILSIAMLFFVAAFSSTASVSGAGGLEIGSTIENFTLPDLNGENRSFNDLKGKNGAVVIWLSAQCPVVKAYNQRVNEIAAEFKAKGINFIGINSNATESLEWVKSDAAEVGYQFPVLIDKDNLLADKFGATVTPEVFYFNAKNVLIYHGAIDNDRSGKNITANYLRDALQAALNGKEIAVAKANAFGCTIKRVKKDKSQ